MITQERAHEIIKEAYGENAYAIGAERTADEITVFYLYAGEPETEYHTHTITDDAYPIDLAREAAFSEIYA